MAPDEGADDPAEVVGVAEDELTTCATFVRATGVLAVQDATLVEDPQNPARADENFGTTPTLVLGKMGSATRLGLLRFDLSPLPADLPIVGAKLRLYRGIDVIPGGVGVYRASAPWTESTVTWNSFNNAFDAAAPIASFSPLAAPVGGALHVDVTAAVQAWVDGSAPNHGFVLSALAGNRATFGSSDSLSPSSFPQLTVCYDAPTCSDGIQNGPETGVDCGGACAPCPDGLGCGAAADCQSGVCGSGLCQPPTCSDGVLNGNEVAADCGGSCVVAELCNGVDDDCNGQIDEGNPEGGAACATGLPGVCAAGTTVCSAGGLSCAADTTSSSELCDGLDNDCNGLADDGVGFAGALASWSADGSAADAVGAHDGTLLGGMGYGSGLAGSAFQFDGVDDGVDFGTTLGNFGTSDFTIEFWLSTKSTRLEGLINKRAVCASGTYFDLRLSSGRIKVEISQTGASSSSFTSANLVNDGSFHHVAVTRQANNVQLYIDGVLDSAKSSSSTLSLSNAAAFSMASHVCIGVDSTQRLTGLLDEVHVFGRALSAAEVAQLESLGGAATCFSP